MTTLPVDEATMWSMLVGFIIPIAVGLVTKKVTSSGVKSTLLSLLAAASGLGSQAIAAANDNVGFDLKAGITASLFTFATAVAAHYGLWKPTGASDAAQSTLNKAPATDVSGTILPAADPGTGSTVGDSAGNSVVVATGITGGNDELDGEPLGDTSGLGEQVVLPEAA